MLKFIEDKNINKYLKYLASNSTFILQHFMKVYLYTDHKSSEGIRAPNWTLDHWKREIYENINPCVILNSKIPVFDKLPDIYSKRYLDALNPYKLNWNELIQIFINGFDPNDKHGYYELPKISLDYLNKNKERIFSVYSVLVNRVLNRLIYKGSSFDPSGFFKMIGALITNKYLDHEKLIGLIEDIKFSEDEDDYYRERYLYLQEYFKNG